MQLTRLSTLWLQSTWQPLPVFLRSYNMGINNCIRLNVKLILF
jgi:hypothetical protein